MKCAATLLLVISIPMCQATSRLQASPRISMQKASAHNRVMQYSGGFIYRANYTAQFQYLRDSICFGPQPPVIEVSCIGPNIQLLGTSDPSIVCGPVTTNTDGTSHITCNNTCASTADCQKVYLAQESVTNSYNGPFGEVRFVCEGNTTYDVDAVVKLDGSGNGGCAAASFTRNYQIARMGISCPTQSGDRTYNFDDYFFFCGGTGAGTYSTYAGEAMPGNVFTCYTGTDCNGTACDIVYDQISIYTNLFNVWETCVESTVQITPFPTPAPPDPTQPQLHPISARFQAAWGLLSDPVFGTSACSVNTPTVQITCLHGYNLTFVTTTSATSNCTTVNRSAIECIEYNTSSFVNQFTGVVYVSGKTSRGWDDHRSCAK